MALFAFPSSQQSLLRATLRTATRSTSSCISPSSPSSRLLSRCASQQRSISRPCTIPSVRPMPRNRVLWQRQVCLTQRRSFFSGQNIIRDYENLPRDYRDKIGLPFRSKDLTDEEVERIFGPDLGSAAANHLLRILHGRRVAGTLDDPAFVVHTAQFQRDQIGKGLEYLRKKVPVDEVVNAGLRAEDELAQLELDAETKETEKAKATTAKDEKEGKDVDDTSKHEADPVYGHSSFDAIRARNLAKAKQREEALREEEEERTRNGEAPEKERTGPLALLRDSNRVPQNPAVAKYYQEAESPMKEAPQMTAWQRIGPSAVAVVLAVGFLASLAMVYQEPSPRYRLLPEFTTAQATVGAVIALNLVVFLGWKIPPLWKLFNRYMMLTVGLPKPVALFTSPFSHKQIGHLLANMVPLWFVGTYLHEDVGRAGFLALYLGCGAVGFLGTLTTYTMANMLGVFTLGASGATIGLVGAYFWGHRTDGFRVMGLPQDGVQGIVWLALLVGVHLAGLRSMFSPTNRIDMASHLAGLAAGVGGMEIITRMRKKSDGDNHEDGGSSSKVVIKDLWSGREAERKRD